MATKKKKIKEPMVEEPYVIGFDTASGNDRTIGILFKRENGKLVAKKTLLAYSEMGRHRESLAWIKANPDV